MLRTGNLPLRDDHHPPVSREDGAAQQIPSYDGVLSSRREHRCHQRPKGDRPTNGCRGNNPRSREMRGEATPDVEKNAVNRVGCSSSQKLTPIALPFRTKNAPETLEACRLMQGIKAQEGETGVEECTAWGANGCRHADAESEGRVFPFTGILTAFFSIYLRCAYRSYLNLQHQQRPELKPRRVARPAAVGRVSIIVTF